ncbi:hypothetical protein [Actinocorallia lasiicapitis]
MDTPVLPKEVRVSLTEARAMTGFPILLPTVFPEPTEVVVSDSGRVVSMNFGTVHLDQFDGHVNTRIFGKFLSADTDLYHPTNVNGAKALWINGPHEIWYIDRHGTDQTASAHTAGNTLIWQSGPTALRLEGAPTLPKALHIATSTH